jgi:hypothetical protein
MPCQKDNCGNDCKTMFCQYCSTVSGGRFIATEGTAVLSTLANAPFDLCCVINSCSLHDLCGTFAWIHRQTVLIQRWLRWGKFGNDFKLTYLFIFLQVNMQSSTAQPRRLHIGLYRVVNIGSGIDTDGIAASDRSKLRELRFPPVSNTKENFGVQINWDEFI